MTSKHIGSSFDDFLKEEGRFEEADAVAVKRVIAWQLDEARKHQKLPKNRMALLMGTSRAQLDRVLDPTNPALTLESLTKAAGILGKSVKIELVGTSGNASRSRSPRARPLRRRTTTSPATRSAHDQKPSRAAIRQK